MKIQQWCFEQGQYQPQALQAELQQLQPQLILGFGGVGFFTTDTQWQQDVLQACPNVEIAGCSTAGEIAQDGVHNNALVLTAIHFEHPDFAVARAPLSGMEASEACGAALASAFPKNQLQHAWVLGQGVGINGSALIAGFTSVAGPTVSLSGGLAGDGGAFERTHVVTRDGFFSDQVVAVGLLSDKLRLQHGSFGGWQPFGPARKITRAAGNVLYELDGEPALEIYKRYLGEHAKNLPGSGLLFPFAILGDDHNAIGLIRTILGIDEANGSLILAGDIQEGTDLKLMHASTDALVDGAEAAAEAATQGLNAEEPGLVMLVSCVGRKLVMGARVDEEVEAVGEVFGQNAVLTGFYSYGEISPFTDVTDCRLHNQTMTIAYLSEAH